MKYLAPIHIGIALLFQAAAWWLTGSLQLGVVISAAWFISREWSEAEYRYIDNFTDSHLRKDMPLWGPLYWKVWAMSPKSLTDFINPIAVTAIIAWRLS